MPSCKYPHIELYRQEIERIKTEHPEYYRNRAALLRLIEDVGMQEHFDMLCAQAIAEAAGFNFNIDSWTSLLTKYLMEHEGLFKHRNIMLNLL
jgi:hypothetical protein